MEICKRCKFKSTCSASSESDLCLNYEPRPLTNADRIRAMSDEELADFLWSIGQNPLTGNTYLNGKFIFFSGNGNGWLDWLKQEADT